MIMRRLLLLVAFIISHPVYSADNVDIKVTGRIVASPCVFNGGSSNLNVDLGNIQATNMAIPGSLSESVLFNLRFTQCPTGTRSVTAIFTGTPDPVAGADYYMNSGTATNIAIAMTEAGSGMLKGTGSSLTQTIAADRTATLLMRAAVKSVAGGATPGTLSAVVVLTLEYN